jgi:hypothetical protein
MMYCAVNIETNRTYVGTLDEVVTNVFMYRIDEQRQLYIKAEGYVETKKYSYSSAWSSEDMHRDVRATLAQLLRSRAYPIWILFKEVE